MKNSNNKNVMITLKNAPRPEDFPIGSLESRAAARGLLARKRQANEYRFRVVYQGLGNPDLEIEYIVNGRDVKTIGRVPTIEEFLAHPACQPCDPKLFS
jgi:hypothetical protein